MTKRRAVERNRHSPRKARGQELFPVRDANGHELVHHDRWGLRLCEVCNLVMSEGYVVEDGVGYACSDACLIKAGWVIEHPENGALIIVTLAVLATWSTDVSIFENPDDDDNPPSCPVFWTDWEGDGNPMDYTVCGIIQARILEWLAFPFSRGSSQPRD